MVRGTLHVCVLSWKHRCPAHWMVCICGRLLRCLPMSPCACAYIDICSAWRGAVQPPLIGCFDKVRWVDRFHSRLVVRFRAHPAAARESHLLPLTAQCDPPFQHIYLAEAAEQAGEVGRLNCRRVFTICRLSPRGLRLQKGQTIFTSLQIRSPHGTRQQTRRKKNMTVGLRVKVCVCRELLRIF